jgi:hypothetical protein
MDWMDESRKALETFKRLERETAELDKMRRGSAAAVAPAGPERDR